MALISPDTIDRIVMNLKGRMKTLVVDRDATLVYSTLKLMHKVLELDKEKRILDFELVQSLVLNLDHTNQKIFNETVDFLAHNHILEDSSYLKVIFTADSLNRIIEIFPTLNAQAKVNFCLTVIFEFTHDTKAAGTIMAKGGKQFYSALHTNLLNGDKKARVMIMKILYQLLKFNAKNGPVELFPDWNTVVRFLNLNYGEIKEKEFDIFCQAVVTILNLSSKNGFLDRVNCIELLKHCSDGVVNKSYQNRDLEMKNIILEVAAAQQILRNILYADSPNRGEKLNSVFRNKSFNLFEFSLRLFEPFYATNVSPADRQENISQFGTPILEFFVTISDTPLFRSIYKARVVEIEDLMKRLYSVCANSFPTMGKMIEMIQKNNTKGTTVAPLTAENVRNGGDGGPSKVDRRTREELELLNHQIEKKKALPSEVTELREVTDKLEADDYAKRKEIESAKSKEYHQKIRDQEKPKQEKENQEKLDKERREKLGMVS